MDPINKRMIVIEKNTEQLNGIDPHANLSHKTNEIHHRRIS